MKTLNRIIFIALVIILFVSCSFYSTKDLETQIQIVAEQAYFEGQKDALNGDIRIKMSTDSIYIWTKSCWDEKTDPIYQPTYLDSKKQNNMKKYTVKGV